MPKQIEVQSLQEVETDMRDQGSTEEVIDIVKQQLENIEPGEHHPEYNQLIYIAVMPDDSASIAGDNPSKRDNTQDVIEGHNNLIDALKGSQQKRFILFKTQCLNNDTPLNNWVPLDEAQVLTRANFRPGGGTPLYDKTLALLSSVMFEKSEALKRGVSSVRWGILLITDGDDTASTNRADKVKLIIDDMRKTGELLDNCEPNDKTSGSIALMGVEDRDVDPGASTFFANVAASIGINWGLHANRTNPTEMRRAFNTFSAPFLR